MVRTSNYNWWIVMLIILGTILIVWLYINGETLLGIKRHHINGYEVVEISGLLSPAECDELMRYSRTQNMTKSEVLSSDNSNPHHVTDLDSRDSLTLWIDDDEHPLAVKMANSAKSWTYLPNNKQDKLQVVKYNEGGMFHPHYDAQYGSNTSTRCATLLVYLNDDYDGGETSFVDIGLTIQPEKGKGILFWTLDANRKIIPQAKHCGEKVRRGNKWICTKWVHVDK
jgi:prolyl 4-hydroxylase